MILRTLILSISFTIVASPCFAQLDWVKNLDEGQKIAKKEGKLVLLDFWAIWCGPCRSMDTGMWNTSKMEELSDRFVLVKIDIDQNPQIARSYGIKSIPRVIVTTSENDRLLDVTGYGGSQPFFEKFEAMPADMGDIALALTTYEEEKTPDNRFDLAIAYQETALTITDARIKSTFLGISSKHFSKAAKKTNSEELEQYADMNLALNAAIAGREKKAMKMMNKLSLDMQNQDISDFANYVMAYCYNCQGKTEKVEELKAEIVNEDLRASIGNQ